MKNPWYASGLTVASVRDLESNDGVGTSISFFIPDLSPFFFV